MADKKEHDLTADDYLRMVQDNGLRLKDVPDDARTLQIERTAVENNWKAIQYANFRTRELTKAAELSRLKENVSERYGVPKGMLSVKENDRKGFHLVYFQTKGFHQLLARAGHLGKVEKWMMSVEAFKKRNAELLRSLGHTKDVSDKGAADSRTKTDIKPEKELPTEKNGKLDENIKEIESKLAYRANAEISMMKAAKILGCKTDGLLFEGNVVVTKDGSRRLALEKDGTLSESASKYLDMTVARNLKESIEKTADLYGISAKELFYDSKNGFIQSKDKYRDEHEKTMPTGSICISVQENGTIAPSIWQELQQTMPLTPDNISFQTLGIVKGDSFDRDEERIVKALGYDKLKNILPFDKKILSIEYKKNGFQHMQEDKWEKTAMSKEFDELLDNLGVTKCTLEQRISILKRTAIMQIDEDRARGFTLYADLSSGQKKMVNDPNPSIRKMAAEIGYGLDVLKKDQNPEIQMTVLSHNGYGRDEIIKNAKTANVQKMLVAQDPSDPGLQNIFKTTQSESVRADIVTNCLQYMPEKLVAEQFKKEDSDHVLCAYAKQGYELDVLSKSRRTEVRLAAVEQLAARGDDISQFAKDSSFQVKIVVARNGYSLAELMNDPNKDVQRAAEEKYGENVETALDIISSNTNKDVFTMECGRDLLVCESGTETPIAKLNSCGIIDYYVNGFGEHETDAPELDGNDLGTQEEDLGDM